MKLKTQNSKLKTSGFALLFAVLVASVLLSIGVSIFSLTTKELALSSSGRESEYAFYSADSGAECAYYWDTTGATEIPEQSPFVSGSGTINCGGSPISITSSSNGGTATSTTFNMIVSDDSADNIYYCAVVNVSKNSSGTTIQSRGYNICQASSPSMPDYGNQNLVERGLEINY